MDLSERLGIDQAEEVQYRATCTELLRLVLNFSGCVTAIITTVGAGPADPLPIGLGASEAEYDFAICAQTLLPPDNLMIVPDIRSDRRVPQQLPTKAAANIHFFAGVLLTDSKGAVLGGLSIMDREPQKLSAQAIAAIEALGRSFATMMSLRRAAIRAGRQSMIDNATSLPNRPAFLHALSQTLSRQERDRNPFSLLYFDLDGLKGINEALGWRVGNALLQEVSVALRACLRAEDIAARIGDDQFAAILVGGDGSEAALAGERIRALVKTQSDSAGWPITVSVGAVSFLTRPCDEADALDMVDFLMFSAKQAGQDRVVCRNYDAARLPFDS
jgi:diguanylate cyclase (GGDEF)-like protein